MHQDTLTVKCKLLLIHHPVLYVCEILREQHRIHVAGPVLIAENIIDASDLLKLQQQ